MTLNVKWSIPHIYPTTTPKFHISVHVALWSANFMHVYRLFWETSAPNGPKMTEHKTGHRYCICMTQVGVWNCTTFCNMANCFRIRVFKFQLSLETSSTNEPQMNWNNTRSKVPHVYNPGTIESKFHEVLLYKQPSSSYKLLWDKFTELPLNDLEHQGGNVPHICSIRPYVPTFNLFCSMVICIKVTGQLRQVKRMAPKWTWALRGQTYPIYVPTVCQIYSIAQRLLVTGHFETSELKYPKMTMNNQD